MNEATKKTLSQFKELTDSEQHDARQKFVRMKEATQIYHMSRTKLAEEALKAGAMYKIGSTILINVQIFDEYLEGFRIPGVML